MRYFTDHTHVRMVLLSFLSFFLPGAAALAFLSALCAWLRACRVLFMSSAAAAAAARPCHLAILPSSLLLYLGTLLHEKQDPLANIP